MKRGRRIMYKHIDFAGTVYSPLNIVHVVLSCPGLPDEAGRLEILNIHTAQMKSHGKLHPNVDIVNLASRTRNFSGAEIEGLVRSAQATAMNKMIQVHCMHVCVHRALGEVMFAVRACVHDCTVLDCWDSSVHM